MVPSATWNTPPRRGRCRCSTWRRQTLLARTTDQTSSLSKSMEWNNVRPESSNLILLNSNQFIQFFIQSYEFILVLVVFLIKQGMKVEGMMLLSKPCMVKITVLDFVFSDEQFLHGERKWDGKLRLSPGELDQACEEIFEKSRMWWSFVSVFSNRLKS